MGHTQIDLHIHTRESDGSLLVKDVIREAFEREVRILALTDHETTNGVQEAIALSREYNIKIIPGVELVTAYKGQEVHLLGYFNFAGFLHSDLQSRLKELREQRTALAYDMVKRLQRDGYTLKWSEVERIANPEGAVSKSHIMRALHDHENGTIQWPSIAKLFQPYGVAYLPFLEHSFEEAVQLIYACGGVPVLAHPGLIGNQELVGELLSYRPIGLEVYYGYWDQRETLIDHYEKLAKSKALFTTGGSDFHGLNGPVTIGEVDVPLSCAQDLVSYLKLDL
ncbi:PHP domain-containing protein [Desulfitobacterium dichloroeliminans]|uniref:PHP domain-containing protein n=1 Tax=Desulfitobacterium dichloroeliminans TaxID=233055 RepID=UPI00059C961C|nr:PHP domain-containing protein [Desulfitobacterium dichloroeliminans]